MTRRPCDVRAHRRDRTARADTEYDVSRAVRAATTVVDVVEMAQSRKAAATAAEPGVPAGWRAFMVGFSRMNDYSRRFWRNRVSAWYTGSKWFHAELYFPLCDGGMYGVTANDPVGFYGRLDSRERYGADWEWHVMAVPPATYARLLRWCQERVRRGATFDACGFLCFPCPSMLDPGGNRYLCSGLTAHALIASGVLAHARVDRPAAMAPTALRELVRSAPQDDALHHWQVNSFVVGERVLDTSVPAPPAPAAAEPILERTRRERAAAAAAPVSTRRQRFRFEVEDRDPLSGADTVLRVETTRPRDARRAVGWMLRSGAGGGTTGVDDDNDDDDDDNDAAWFFSGLLGNTPANTAHHPVRDV